VEDARRRITSRTRAIAPVHLFGNPCDIDAIQTLADEYSLTMIWDAAQAHGACYDSQDIGSLDDAVCYSFYPSKNMTTAEGGMITTNNKAVYDTCKLLRSHGQAGKYYHTMLGFNYRLTDVMAALGLKQLDKLDGWVERRRANAQYLSKKLAGVPGIQVPVEQTKGKSSFNLYSILLDLDQFDCNRDEFVRRLNAENIGASVHYPKPLHQQPIFATVAKDVHLPVSEDVSQRILSIPAHPALSTTELDLVVAAVAKVARVMQRAEELS
jgi:perosamine synthetase